MWPPSAWYGVGSLSVKMGPQARGSFVLREPNEADDNKNSELCGVTVETDGKHQLSVYVSTEPPRIATPETKLDNYRGHVLKNVSTLNHPEQPETWVFPQCTQVRVMYLGEYKRCHWVDLDVSWQRLRQTKLFVTVVGFGGSSSDVGDYLVACRSVPVNCSLLVHVDDEQFQRLVEKNEE